MLISYEGRVLPNLPMSFLSCRTKWVISARETLGQSPLEQEVVLNDTWWSSFRLSLEFQMLFCKMCLTSDWCLGDIVRGQFINMTEQGIEIGVLQLWKPHQIPVSLFLFWTLIWAVGQDNWPSSLLKLSPTVQPNPHVESIHWALPPMPCWMNQPQCPAARGWRSLEGLQFQTESHPPAGGKLYGVDLRCTSRTFAPG